MSKFYESIMEGLTEAIARNRLETIKDIDDARLRDLCAAEREGRVYVSQYPNCGMCKWVTIDMFATIEPCKSCRDRAMAEAASAGKGE